MKTIVCCGCDRSVNLTEWYPPRLTEGWLYDRDSKLWLCPACAAYNAIDDRRSAS